MCRPRFLSCFLIGTFINYYYYLLKSVLTFESLIVLPIVFADVLEGAKISRDQVGREKRLEGAGRSGVGGGGGL